MFPRATELKSVNGDSKIYIDAVCWRPVIDSSSMSPLASAWTDAATDSELLLAVTAVGRVTPVLVRVLVLLVRSSASSASLAAAAV